MSSLAATAVAPLAPASQAVAGAWRRLALGRTGPTICFLWAVGEATVWPVIPDVALFALLLAAPRRAPRLLLATTAGACIGGVITVAAATLAPHAALTVVTHVPLVHPRSIPVVESHLATQPLPLAFLYQPWSGIPFKLWAVLATTGGYAPLAVVPCFVLGRLGRFAAVALVGAGIGRLLERRLDRIAVPLLLLCSPTGVWLFYTVAIRG
jgi:membrane protein YqaA with SNARE-associated domain